MLVFLVIVVLLLVAVLVFLLRPLLRPNTTVKTDGGAEKREIFRQQFDEIEQDKINGMLDTVQYDIAKNELERRVLDEVVVAQAAASSASPDRRLAIILLVIFPLAAFLLYFKLGNPAAIMAPATSPMISQENISGEHNTSAADIELLLNTLKSKLEKTPGDGTGWALLARAYAELGRHADAANAYEKAVKAIPNDPQLLADYADALAVVNANNLAGKPEELVNQALKLDPHHVKSLMLAAAAAFDRKDYKQAIVFWERLQQDLPADSAILPEVKAALNEAYALSGIKPQAQSTPASEKKVISTASISGTVKIAPDLTNKLDPAATVFVFARATQGSPMPLAIVRTSAKNLPYKYTLDDNTALMPGNKLSQANEVVVIARISKNGDAKAKTGDLQGLSASIKPDGRIVDIEINQVVP
jgi:cytochrome c-type biogenesis protein CcmH